MHEKIIVSNIFSQDKYIYFYSILKLVTGVKNVKEVKLI